MLDSSITPAAHVLHMYMMSAVRQHECVQHAYNIFVRGITKDCFFTSTTFSVKFTHIFINFYTIYSCNNSTEWEKKKILVDFFF